MSPNQTLTFTQQVNAPPEQVYRAFTNSTALREWLSNEASALAKPVGRLYLWWNDGYYASGEYKSLKPEKEVSFTWQGKNEPGPSEVTVTLTKQEEGTLVTLEHTGIGSGEEWGETIKEIRKGWEHSLENLASVLETGQDLRFVNRPMLGVLVSDYDAEIAKKLGVPAIEGIRIDGVVDGMGAQAAGLKSDDVLVGLAGKEVTGGASLTNGLQRLQAGAEVEVEFYRGNEKKSVNMKLSRRPMHDIPDSPKALAKEVEEKYANMESTLDNFFENITEEHATFKPAPDVWSAKENLAHLIHSERGWHSWITDLVSGFEPMYDDYGGNPQARVEATLQAYPTIAELREELRRNCAETVAFLEKLPEKFVARKGSYWRLAYEIVDQPYHFNSHLDQMRNAVKKAHEG